METESISTQTLPSPIEVEISDNQSYLDADRAFLDGLVRRVLLAEGVELASISIALVDDATIRVINRRHLDHDWPTDVISFDLSEPGDRILTGELVVSTEMASATAKEADVDPLSELALYIVHGLLHLCGLDDQEIDDAEIMRRRENEHLHSEGLINTFPLVGLAKSDDEGRESVCWPR